MRVSQSWKTYGRPSVPLPRGCRGTQRCQPLASVSLKARSPPKNRTRPTSVSHQCCESHGSTLHLMEPRGHQGIVWVFNMFNVGRELIGRLIIVYECFLYIYTCGLSCLITAKLGMRDRPQTEHHGTVPWEPQHFLFGDDGRTFFEDLP